MIFWAVFAIIGPDKDKAYLKDICMENLNLADSGIASEKRLRVSVLRFAICIAVFYGIWFGAVCYRIGNFVLSAIDFSMALLFIFAGIITYKKPESTLPESLVAISTSLFFFYLFASGGVSGIGPLWSFVFPPIAFFLVGFRGGVALTLGYLLLCVAVLFFERFFPGWFYSHNPLFIERFIGIYLLSASVSGAYEYQKMKTENVLRELIGAVATARDQAQSANQVKSRFLAVVSHEIRNPVNGINGTIELLNTTSLDPEQKEYLELMRQSCDSLLHLLNDILDLSRIESGKFSLETTDILLQDFLNSIVESIRILAQNKNLQITRQLADNLPARINGDPVRLRQILVNLLNNAVKFTHEGSVCLKATCEARENAGCFILFEVIDTGIGIAEDKIHLLFQDFHQTDSSTTRLFGGSGLGLAISRRLTELMGGTIGVESVPQKGSRFFFRIPVA